MLPELRVVGCSGTRPRVRPSRQVPAKVAHHAVRDSSVVARPTVDEILTSPSGYLAGINR